jgi:hypothetical protein
LFTISYPADPTKGVADSPDCANKFINGLINGCDGNDPVNNPQNYKFGGNLSTADGWIFTFTPLAQQPDGDTCDVSYQFIDDYFEVRGKNFPDAKLGINGEGLKADIEHCGPLTAGSWEFTWTPDDCCYQWYAHGKLAIGTKSCIGSAVIAAGGKSTGNCNGAG